MRFGRAYGLFGVSSAMACLALWLTVGVADAQPSSPLPGGAAPVPAAVRQAAKPAAAQVEKAAPAAPPAAPAKAAAAQAVQAAPPPSAKAAPSAARSTVSSVTSTVAHAASTAAAAPAPSAPKPPAPAPTTPAAAPKKAVEPVRQTVAPVVEQVEQAAAPVAHVVAPVVDEAQDVAAPVADEASQTIEPLAPVVPAVAAAAAPPPAPLASVASPITGSAGEPAPSAAEAPAPLPPIDLAPQSTQTVQSLHTVDSLQAPANAAPTVTSPPPVDILSGPLPASEPAHDDFVAHLARPGVSARAPVIARVQVDMAVPTHLSLAAGAFTHAAAALGAGLDRQQPSGPSPPIDGTSSPPVSPIGTSSNLGSSPSPGTTATLFSTGLLVAATWRALEFAARLRKLGITLPELAPPG